jgi:hypothetical protein
MEQRIPWKTSFGAAVTVTVTLVVAAAQTSGAGPEQRGLASDREPSRIAASLEGTWRVESTILDCQTGAVGPTAPILNTFLAGGSMLSQPSANPALLSPGHGVWKHVGGRTFENTVVLFQFNPANGMYAGTVTIQRDIRLEWNLDEYTSTDSVEASDPNGNVIGRRCATTVGRRLG